MTQKQSHENADVRDRPVRTMVALVVGFLVIVGVAVGAVLVPELRDDTEEAQEATERSAARPSPSAPTPSAAAPSAAVPSAAAPSAPTPSSR